MREGATVVICGRKAETIEQAARAIGVDSVTRDFGRIDILVNNAGANLAQAPCLRVDERMFDKMIEINLKSAFLLTQLVAPGMCERGGIDYQHCFNFGDQAAV